ncbi:hypothetical protein ACG1BZ_05650 [Microbulbifer sp. CNSA002]|uniref:hypothetical protein n=1 Tax=Microbulbifer sp. CNSA002 TaxID=3373604 RepID=UPI0039B6096C
MKTRATFVFFLFLVVSCTKRYDISLIVNEAIGFKPKEDFVVVAREKASDIAKYFGDYNEIFYIEMSEHDYASFMKIVEEGGSWKLQPKSSLPGSSNFPEWEKIMYFKQYGLLTIFRVRGDRRAITIQVYEQ